MSAVALLFVLLLLAGGAAGAASAVARAARRPHVTDAGARPAWVRFHVRYYTFALLFIAFDMEMAYMYPWAVVFRSLGWFALGEGAIFLLVLGVGILYA